MDPSNRLGIYVICARSDRVRRKFVLLLLTIASIFTLFISVREPISYMFISKPHEPPKTCPFRISEETISPLRNTKHLLVSAFMDQRVKGFDIRIIGIFRRDSIEPLNCLFCCGGQLSNITTSKITQNPQNFGFPFVATDVMCQIPKNCSATHVSLVTTLFNQTAFAAFKQTWLPIRNLKTEDDEEKRLQFNFTVCVSNLFGGYNNVLQVAQSLEMYRLLGVDRVVIYNTSCGPELDRLLQNYSQEGFVEIVPWPIDQYLNPSPGWIPSRDGGEVHYFGQLATLNECIYRSMDRSRFVLLNDIDEIIMPYKHNNLMSLMNMLQQKQPNTGVFSIKNGIFPKKHTDSSLRFHLPKWDKVPGLNILEHIYREPQTNKYYIEKLIINPRMVEQTSVHSVIKNFGKKYWVPETICRVIHTRKPLLNGLRLEKLYEDKRLWDFSEKLIPNVDRVLKRAGLLS